MALFGAPTAQALPTSEIEPNDDIFQMTGPIGPGGASGQVASGSDQDFFLVRLRPQRQIEIHFSAAQCSAGEFEVETLDGTDIAEASYLYDNESDTDAVTTPGIYGGPSFIAKIVVSTRNSGSCNYTVGFTGAGGGATDVVDSSPLPALPKVATSEPNDFEGQANGPLSADVVYTGVIETDNDVDWLYVPLLGGTTLTMEFSTGSVQANAELLTSATSSSVVALSPAANTSNASSYSVPYSATYYVRLWGSLGARYRLQLSPASAIGYPAPYFWIASRKVKRGRSIRIYVENSSATSLTWTLRRKGNLVKRGTSAIRSGVAKIPTGSLRRHKKYKLRFTVPGVGTRSATISIR